MNAQKTIWIVANWKSRVPLTKAVEWIKTVAPSLPQDSNVRVVVCASFSSLSEISKLVKIGNFPIQIGSQDLSRFEPGAYTGEEPAQLLRDMITISLLGHSERRLHLNETDTIVADKVRQAREHGIEPLVCIQGADTQIPEGITLLAYEPVFAIGTGNADTPEDANQIAGQIKVTHPEIQVLYGGSVTSENVTSFINQEHLSGVLVGTASIDPQEFLKIINKV